MLEREATRLAAERKKRKIEVAKAVSLIQSEVFC
jgi:hypothetical protein